jgi:hypothetical protein
MVGIVQERLFVPGDERSPWQVIRQWPVAMKFRSLFTAQNERLQ